MKRNKKIGNIYTPESIVKMMLDYGGYIVSAHIRKKHVMDNSCGDGRFLQEILKRYIESYMLTTDLFDTDEIRHELEVYIHGIDIESAECDKCRKKLSDIALLYGIDGVEWDIRCENSLAVKDFHGKMDYVFGNPPYVRIHNLKNGGDSDEYRLFRGFHFAENGMSDLYLAFYELGLRMRNDNGILCYIAPSAWLSSLSGTNMRRYVKNTKELSHIIDFEDIQVFDGVTTYVMITLFDKRPHSYIQYDKFDEENEYFYSVSGIPYSNIFINDKMYIATKSELSLIRDVEKTRTGSIVVKNGYATLADDVFINNLPPLSKYTIDVLKISTNEWKKCLFPYDKDMNPLSLGTIKDTAPDVYDYIIQNEEALKHRTYDKTKCDYWHLIGRSQGLGDTYKNKIATNFLIRNAHDLKINEVGAGKGVYSGFYVLTDLDFSAIEKVMKNDSFVNYVKSLRKYKSGGYYTFSTKDLEKYLNYVLYAKEIS